MAMRELGHICLACRVKMLAAASRGPVSRLSRRARAITVSPASSAYSTAASSAQPPIRPAPAPAYNSGSRRDGGDGGAGASAGAGAGAGASAGASASGSASLAMFQSIIENQPRQPAHRPPAGDALDAELLKNIERVTAMLKADANPAAIFSSFDQTIYPQIKEQKDSPAYRLAKGQLQTFLAMRMVAAKAEALDPSDLPTATHITQVLVDLEFLNLETWSTLMLQLSQQICQLSASPDGSLLDEKFKHSLPGRDALLADLGGAWDAFAGSCTKLEASGHAVDDINSRSASRARAALPTHSRVPEKDVPSNVPRATKDYLKVLFPQYSERQLAGDALRAAHVASVLLKDLSTLKPPFDQQTTPFLLMHERLISKCGRSTLLFLDRIRDRYPILLDYVYARAEEMGAEDAASWPFKPLRSPKPLSFQLRIEQAIKRRNLKELNSAWADFWGDEPLPGPARVNELAATPEIFDSFILGFVRMRRLMQAIDVWNRMQRVGIKASTKTWTNMIQGCANTRNPRGIKAVWEKLVISDTELDTAVWTARISGLITSGDPEGGILALDEMARLWRERPLHPDAPSQAIQPTIEPINGTIAGLIRLGRMSDAQRVLSWAGRQGINPDIYTFNTLLRPLVRGGQTEHVAAIFNMMQELSIKPDVATYTILVDGALANIGSQTPKQQIGIVSKIIASMEGSGLEANIQTYAKMIYVLLREGDSATAAVQAILAHIQSRGLELSSHIYTMLAEHYFSRDPPNPAAVTALIHNRNLQANKNIDRVFWERVIKGYCHTGETARAVDIFKRIFNSGSTITFSTLDEFLLALIRTGQMAEASSVVKLATTIKEGDELMREGGRFWKHRFWHHAEQYGLLPDDLRHNLQDAEPQTDYIY
ncbi:hypothetical protein B0T24DRAFT_614668 [Lasiosphaeria ovina]|uniref:Pentatricopeptide repeat-containing protein n=1 Tax=Lasiosphaeria ovina TaxID=92902 RepID=A0AAE0NEZ5_9PEZI|nr:hypothetical protein B0T24DRAFT_614668 [Lasiosphaeria ovina]